MDRPPAAAVCRDRHEQARRHDRRQCHDLGRSDHISPATRSSPPAQPDRNPNPAKHAHDRHRRHGDDPALGLGCRRPADRCGSDEFGVDFRVFARNPAATESDRNSRTTPGGRVRFNASPLDETSPSLIASTAADPAGSVDPTILASEIATLARGGKQAACGKRQLVVGDLGLVRPRFLRRIRRLGELACRSPRA